MSFDYPYSFEAPLDRFGVGRTRKVWYTVLFLPATLQPELPFAAFPRLRVEGEIADLPVEGAWMPTGDGRRYFIVAPRALKGGGVAIGGAVEMRFRIADQNAVDVPPELRLALAGNADAQAVWDGLTAGKRRGLTHRVHAAKTPTTRLRRIAEVIADLLG